MADWIKSRGAQLIVGAGYMELLSPEFVQRFRERIINVHPSLLPQFPGLHAIEQAYNAKVSHTGVSVHYIDEGVDTGDLISQVEVPIDSGMELPELEARIHRAEHQLLPSVLRDFATGKLSLPRGQRPMTAQVPRSKAAKRRQRKLAGAR